MVLGGAHLGDASLAGSGRVEVRVGYPGSHAIPSSPISHAAGGAFPSSPPSSFAAAGRHHNYGYGGGEVRCGDVSYEEGEYTSLSFTMPPGTGCRTLRVVVEGRGSAPVPFLYSPPVLLSVPAPIDTDGGPTRVEGVNLGGDMESIAHTLEFTLDGVKATPLGIITPHRVILLALPPARGGDPRSSSSSSSTSGDSSPLPTPAPGEALLTCRVLPSEGEGLRPGAALAWSWPSPPSTLTLSYAPPQIFWGAVARLLPEEALLVGGPPAGAAAPLSPGGGRSGGFSPKSPSRGGGGGRGGGKAPSGGGATGLLGTGAAPSITLYGRNLGSSTASIKVLVNGTVIPNELIKLLLPHSKLEVGLTEALSRELSREAGRKRRGGGGGGGGGGVGASILVSVDGKDAEPFFLSL